MKGTLLRHCATSRKVAGSFPDCVIGHNPSGRTPALGLTQPRNRNEYQEYLLGGRDGRCLGLTTLPLSCAGCLEIWEPQPCWNPQGLSRAVLGDVPEQCGSEWCLGRRRTDFSSAVELGHMFEFFFLIIYPVVCRIIKKEINKWPSKTRIYI